jgi:hypothetical protein
MGCTHVLACGVRKIHGSGPWVGQAEKHLPPSVPPSSLISIMMDESSDSDQWRNNRIP